MGRKGGIGFDAQAWYCDPLEIVEILFGRVESYGIYMGGGDHCAVVGCSSDRRKPEG